MLLSTKYRFVFIHIGKNGGDAIAGALQPFASQGYWSADSSRKHWPAFMIKEGILIDRWYDYFSFAVVSNPWRWLHSSYHYIVMTSLLYSTEKLHPELANWRKWTLASPDDYTRLWIEEAKSNAALSFEKFVFNECDDFLERFPGGQIRKWCLDKDGSPLVSRVLSYEKLGSEWPTLCNYLGLPSVELLQINPTIMANGCPRATQDYRREYTSTMVERVREAFSLDISRFDFTFD